MWLNSAPAGWYSVGMMDRGAPLLSHTLRVALLCAVSLSAPGAHALFGSNYGDVLRRDWHVYESRHFRVISDSPESEVGRRIHDLELFRTYVRATMGLDLERHRIKVRRNKALRAKLDERVVPEHERIDVYMFSRRAHLIRLMNSRDVYGFMQPGLRKSLMVIAPNTTSETPNTVAFHEYVHFLLRAVGGSHFPPWYEEGLAEFFAATRITKDALVIGEVPLLRLQNLQNRHRFSVAEVFDTGSPRLPDLNSLEEGVAISSRPLANPAFYAQSWSLIHMLLLGHHAGLQRRDHLLADYVLDIQNGRDPQAALQRHFQGEYRALERDVRKYISRRSKIPRLSIPLNQFDYDPRYSRTRIDRTELTARLGRLAAPLSHVSARGIFRNALKEQPQAAEVLAGMGLAQRLAGRYSKALQMVQASLEAAPDDPHAIFEFADTISVICQRSRRNDPELANISCRDLVPLAMQGYATALEMMPDNPEFQANYGVALLQTGQLDEATQLLSAAFQRAPWSPGLSFALGECLRRQGEFSAARPLLNRAAVWFFKSPSLQIRARLALALAEQGSSDVPQGIGAEVQLKTLD